MSIIQKVKSAVGMDSTDTTSEKRYHCPECDSEFTSFKTEERAMCIDCMNGEVELLDRTS
jgi:protein-arginine kinase activator protein McsA